MRDIIVHTVNVSHYRLVDLVKIADQAKPFYNWLERKAKQTLSSHLSLNDILTSCSDSSLIDIIKSCYFDDTDEKPLLFDGIGRVYPHLKACFYFFAWMIRDAPQQRLAPLISRMQKADSIKRTTAEIDTLVELFLEYRSIVKSFEWQSIKEVVIDRLEGSRRSISGHHLEANVRMGFITAIQNYYAIHSNYGFYKKVNIAGKQIKIGRHTIDVSIELIPKNDSTPMRILVPIKTRETEGGGHSHIFTRDLSAAINDVRTEDENVKFIVVIIAENWSSSELQSIADNTERLFYFDMNPNRFFGLDENSQIALNKYIESIFHENSN